MSMASGSSGERVGDAVGVMVGVGAAVVGAGVGVGVRVAVGVGEEVSGVGVGSEPAEARRVLGERAVGEGDGLGAGVSMVVAGVDSEGVEGWGVGDWMDWEGGVGDGVEDGPQAVAARVMVRASRQAARVVVASFVNGGLFGRDWGFL